MHHRNQLRTETLWLVLGVFWCLVGLFSCRAHGAEAPAKSSSSEIVVSIKDQKLALIKKGVVESVFPVSTSRYGTGDRPGSYATPVGRLVVREKIGCGCRWGTVFKTRHPTGEILRPNTPGRDPIVTRILWLDGKEACNRHAYSRCIYIHGTPRENLLGKPASYGCVRMRSKDVATLADSLSTGTPVTITLGHLPKKQSSLHGLMASVF